MPTDAAEIVESKVKSEVAGATNDSLAAAIDKLAAELEAGRKPAEPPVTVAPAAPAFTPEQFAASLDEVVERSGGKVGPAIVEALKQTGPAIVQAQMEASAATRRALDTQDSRLAFPDASKTPLLTKYAKEIDAYIKANNIPAAYLATKGYGEIAELVALKDPKYKEALGAQAVEQYKLEQAKAPKPASAPGVETVHAGDVRPGTKLSPDVETQIANIKVDPEQAELNWKRYRVSEADIKRQKYEIEQQYKKHGAEGIRQLGGVPVCELNEVPIEGPSQVLNREQRKVVERSLD